jgi:hypothetical protein
MLLLIQPTTIAAQAPALAADAPLVPLEAPGFVRLISCVLVVTVSCENDACALNVEQVYDMHNRDRAQTAGLRLRLALPTGDGGRPPQPTLRDGQGNTLSPAADAADGTIWDVSLAPEERKTLRLTYRHPITSRHFVRWHWDAPALAAWRTVDGIRAEFRLPQHMTEDAFLSVDPGATEFDGRTLAWEYEGLDAVRPHALHMMTPPTWLRLRDLCTAGAHRDVATLLTDLQETAAREEVAFADRYGEIVAELHAALDVQPDDVQARLALVAMYEARATAMPDLRMNYLLLAAREMEGLLAEGYAEAQDADRLSRIYYDAAQSANSAGDPAAALEYLQKAFEVPGANNQGQTMAREDMALHWALDLAQRGQAAQAMEQLEELLSPGMRDALLRYAPPFRYARTDVTLAPGQRIARYRLALYGPSASATLSWLSEAAERVNELDGCRAMLTAAQDENNSMALLEVSVDHLGVADLNRRAAALRVVLAEQENTLAMAIAAPWAPGIEAYGVEQSRLWDRRRYREQVDLSAMQQAWEIESQYIRWRLIELGTERPADERARMEAQLAAIVMGEQRRIWDGLPSASYWTFRVTYAGAHEPASPWNVGWGQTRDLEATSTILHWPAIRQAALVAAAGLAGLIALFSIGAHLRRRTE